MNFAIIIPIYQQWPHLRRCLDSVLWQLAPEDEVIVVYEAEETEQFVQHHTFYPNRVQWLCSEKRSIGSARNLGVAQAKADWIKFLDADDLLAPFALSSFRAKEIPADIQVVGGAQIKVISGEVCTRLSLDAPPGNFPIVQSNWNAIRECNPSLVSMCYIRRSGLEHIAGFNDEIGFEEDWDLWLRFERAFGLGCFGRVKWPVCYYWIDDGERKQKVRNHQVNGMDVRAYFKKTYGTLT